MDRLMTVREAAVPLRTTEQGLRWRIHNGTAPKSAKVGGRRMFREADIQAWIDAHFQD